MTHHQDEESFWDISPGLWLMLLLGFVLCLTCGMLWSSYRQVALMLPAPIFFGMFIPVVRGIVDPSYMEFQVKAHPFRTFFAAFIGTSIAVVLFFLGCWIRLTLLI